MKLQSVGGDFAVWKARALGEIPLSARHCFVGKTERELSVVCEERLVPPDCPDCEGGWRLFRVAGALDFALIGILARLTGALAAKGVPVFAVSTFDTDYLLVKKEHYPTAVSALREAGCVFEPTVYFIGGSPCSGKSTAAEALAKKYGWRYYKLDDYLEEYMARGAAAGDPLLQKVVGLSLDEIWLREPGLQAEEELAIYRAIFPYAMEAVAQMGEGAPIVAEGAGFLPSLARAAGIAENRYACLTPTREFQYARYAERPWVADYLSGCTEPERAFANWMERDALFAEAVRREAERLGCVSLVTDGSLAPETTRKRLEAVFAPLVEEV